MAVINGEAELMARVMWTSGRIVEADTRVTGGTDGDSHQTVFQQHQYHLAPLQNG